MLKFVFDRRNDIRPWPNLAPLTDRPHDSYATMGESWPFITPCRLLLYAQDHDYPVEVYYTDEAFPADCYYPVGIGWFDFGQDYFGMMSSQLQQFLRDGQLRALFYYHEGDNPVHEKMHLDQLCAEHDLPIDCYRMISGNTACRSLPGFVYFADHELFYWRHSVKYNHRSQPGCSFHDRRRSKKFTALNRTHKWWRATIMADLTMHRPVLDHSYWSYGNIESGDQYHDNPVELDSIPGLETALKDFLSHAPYACDDYSSDQHNQHWTLIPEHFDDSYMHLVFETFFDADGSGGTFITEKTFKPIRHAQPFVIFGTPGTVKTLRELGYRTFDHVIDHGYDAITDNTQRYHALRAEIDRLCKQDLHALYLQCRDDIVHNQQLFLSSKHARLQELESALISN